MASHLQCFGPFQIEIIIRQRLLKLPADIQSLHRVVLIACFVRKACKYANESVLDQQSVARTSYTTEFDVIFHLTRYENDLLSYLQV